MQILTKPCGKYATNCYIIKGENADLVVDPGIKADEFVKQNCTKLYAILNTHGHFDHVWSNEAVKRHFNAPIYIHKDDNFMLADPFKMGHEQGVGDFLIENENEFELGEFRLKFHHFPGHTPGCCMIELVGFGVMFSGDFLFERSIGRWDFEYSDANLMKQSLIKAQNLQGDFRLLPGHGNETSLKKEQASLNAWLRYF